MGIVTNSKKVHESSKSSKEMETKHTMAQNFTFIKQKMNSKIISKS
jgi:hypothetical protein